MRRIQILFFPALFCGLLSLACHRNGPPPPASYPDPPATSYRVESVKLGSDGVPIRAAFVKPEFIQVVHVQPQLGRNFINEECQPAHGGVAILSHGLWRQRYKSDPQVIGTNLELNGRAYTVVGIMPKSFKHPREAEIWLPDESK